MSQQTKGISMRVVRTSRIAPMTLGGIHRVLVECTHDPFAEENASFICDLSEQPALNSIVEVAVLWNPA